MNLENYVGNYLPAEGETCFTSLDGLDVANWLFKQGYHVVNYYNTGRNGLAITKEGYKVSTNGYVSKINAEG